MATSSQLFQMATSSQLFHLALQHATLSNSTKLLAALGAMILFKYRSHAIGTRRRPDLKQPKGVVPLLGHMPLLMSIPGTELYDFFLEQNRLLGPTWSISLPVIGRMIQGDTPENIEHVLKTNFWSYEKGGTLRDKLRDLFGKGIFVADGHDWKFQRKLSGHIFNVKAFREYTSDVFVIEGQRVVDYLTKAADEGIVVDLHELMLKFTLDSFGSISFGKSFGCLENMDEKVDFAVSFDELTATCSDRLLDPAWRLREYLTGVNKKAKFEKDVLGKHAIAIIEKRRREGHHANKKDLLQLFMEAKDENDQPLTDEYISSIILNFTIAGRDTTAQALSWMFYLLKRTGSDPEHMKELVQEIDDVLKDGTPTYESHRELKYAEACFHESLRLYPSLPRNMKQCVKDDVLPDGTRIYKGEWFTWSSYVMGRSESVWGPDAKEYKPSRWINTEKPSQGKFSSFHGGPRVCIGQQFATIEALTIIGMILSKLEITLVEPSKLPPYGISVTMPMLEGLPVRISRRKDTSARAV